MYKIKKEAGFVTSNGGGKERGFVLFSFFL
jgi:hypothetical protein